VKAVLVALTMLLAQLFGAGLVVAAGPHPASMPGCAAHVDHPRSDAPPSHHADTGGCPVSVCQCVTQTLLVPLPAKADIRPLPASLPVKIALSAPRRLDWPPPVRPPLF
jgi:hypothetical protein